MTYFLPTIAGVGATLGITSYDCRPTDTRIHLLSTTTNGPAVATGASTGSLSTSVEQGVSTSSDTSAAATIQKTSGQASSPSQGASNPGSSNPSNSSSSSTNLSTGEIVGIAIGGLIGIVILGLVLWGCFSCFRKCCGTSRKPGTSSYGGTNFEMDRVARWRENQGR